jgi:RNA polymerase sigma factor (sigma-70 family)
MRSRSDDVAVYFAEHAPRLERLVRARVNASAETIEDACSYAWCQLVRRVDVAIDDRAAGWLYRVAVHEGWRLAALERETLRYAPSFDDPEVVEAGVAEPAAPHTVEQLIATRLRLEEIRNLPHRQRRAVLLFAFGLTYAEIAEQTADSVRSVERLLRRATQRLRTVDVDELPPREHAALKSIANGSSIDETATALGLSPATVRDYLDSSRRRLGVRTTAEAISVCGAR